MRPSVVDLTSAFERLGMLGWRSLFKSIDSSLNCFKPFVLSSGQNDDICKLLECRLDSCDTLIDIL